MRLLSLLLLLFLLPALPAQAQIGPPQPRAACHGYSLGVGVHNVNHRWMPYDYDVGRNRIYLEGSLGLNDSLELFGRAGGANWVINDVESYEPGLDKDVSSQGYPTFLSGGVRGNLWECGAFSIGASLEAAWYPGIEKFIRWDYDVYQRLYFDSTVEFNIGLTLGYRLGGTVLYGGPLLHFAYTRVDIRTHEFGPDWDVEDRIDALTVRDKAGFGGFVGWQIPLGECGWHLQLEGAGLRDGYGGAIGFFKAF